jgi:hypothetical protein
MTEQNEPTWGGPVPEKPAQSRWSGRKTAAAVAVAVGVAAAGGFAVYAASGSAGAAARSGPGGVRMGPGGPGGTGGAGGAGGMMNALHGEFTIPDGSGGYRTAIMQTGSVTEITDTTLTAKSADGYTKVYTIGSKTTFGMGTKADITSGDTVTVVATPEGGKATADSITDRAQMPGRDGAGAPPQPGN